MTYHVYILASRRRDTLDIGVTSDLAGRTHEHRSGAVSGLASRCDAKRLVWFEAHDDVRAAIQRETNLKHWVRPWKFALIERTNPDWRDLSDEIAS